MTVLDNLDSGNFLNPEGDKVFATPWIPTKLTHIPETLVFLDEVVTYSRTLPWGAASRKLYNIWEAKEEDDKAKLITALKAYKDYLEDSREKLQNAAREAIRKRPGAKIGLLKNTKFWIRLRLKKPTDVTLSLIRELENYKESSLHKAHLCHCQDIINASDTIVYFPEFCVDNNKLVEL